MKNTKKWEMKYLLFVIISICLAVFLETHVNAQIPDLYRSYGVSEKAYREKEKIVRSKDEMVSYLTDCIKKRKKYIKVDMSHIRVKENEMERIMSQAITKAAGKGVASRDYFKYNTFPAYEYYDAENGYMEYYEAIIEYENLKEKRYLRKKSQQITAGLKRKTDYEKALYISKWIVSNTTYDKTYHSDSAYSTLKKGKGTCLGYTLLFQRLAMAVGLKCYMVTGEAGNERHAWNLVKIGRRYYYLDVCWMDGTYIDGSTFIDYNYFLFGSDFCNRNRTVEKEYKSLISKLKISRYRYGENKNVVYLEQANVKQKMQRNDIINM